MLNFSVANLRRYWNLAKHSSIVQSRFGKVWQDIRQTTKFTSETYERVKAIAIKKGVKIPQPKVDMSVETS
jgi:hypothetical protein